MRGSVARGFLDLDVRGAGAAQSDVIADGVVEQRGFLRDERDGIAQRHDLHVADVLAIDAD